MQAVGASLAKQAPKYAKLKCGRKLASSEKVWPGYSWSGQCRTWEWPLVWRYTQDVEPLGHCPSTQISLVQYGIPVTKRTPQLYGDHYSWCKLKRRQAAVLPTLHQSNAPIFCLFLQSTLSMQCKIYCQKTTLKPNLSQESVYASYAHHHSPLRIGWLVDWFH